jgi:hypothetical protein
MTRLLRVESTHFVAGAIWDKHDGKWRCVRAAPILKWMIGYGAATALARLTRCRYEWEWVR